VFVRSRLQVGLETEALCDDILKASRGEGTLRYYDGAFGGRLGKKIYDFFRKKTGVEIEWFTSSSAQAISLFWNAAYSGELELDVLHMQDVTDVWYPLKARNYLLAYTPPEAMALRKGSDPDGYFHRFSGAAHVSLYNPDKLNLEDLPKNFRDLLQPHWKNRLAVPSPSHMEPVKSLLAWMYAKCGPEYLLDLASQHPKTPTDGRSATQLIAKGESDILVDVGTPRYVEARKSGERVAYFVMEEGAFYKETYLGINSRSRNPTLSKLFVRFLLSPEVQGLLVEEGFDPARTDVTTPEWYFPFVKYDNEGKLIGDSSSYWVDIQNRYREIAERTYTYALIDPEALRFQKMTKD
jgi:iron(III) transport system substrate-binding protein